MPGGKRGSCSLLESIQAAKRRPCDSILPPCTAAAAPRPVSGGTTPRARFDGGVSPTASPRGHPSNPAQAPGPPSASHPPPSTHGALPEITVAAATFYPAGSRAPAAAARTAHVPKLAVFPLQQQAFAYADQHQGLNFRVFSFEDPADGRRAFMAATLPAFWEHYRAESASKRHYYEIIREHSPCHLYFDLEFAVEANPSADGQAMVQQLLVVVKAAFWEVYNICMCDSWVLELDSTTPQKFSRHLLIKVPGCAFRNNRHAGAFVQVICAIILLRAQHCTSYQKLFVAKASGGATLFIDTGVYTRNRAFRLYLSSKAGKAARLLPTRQSQLRKLPPQQVLLATMVSSDLPARQAHRGSACSSGGCGTRRTSLLTMGSADGIIPAKLQLPGGLPALGREDLPPAPPQYGPLPVEGLQNFIESQCTKGGTQGSVRAWSLLVACSRKLLVLNIKGNRWCENVGRQHKSNGIFFVVDCGLGAFYQRCHDPDCRDFRSDMWQLPGHLRAACRTLQLDGEPASEVGCMQSCPAGVQPGRAAELQDDGVAGGTPQLLGGSLPVPRHGTARSPAGAPGEDVEAMLCDAADELEYEYYCLQAVEAAERAAFGGSSAS